MAIPALPGVSGSDRVAADRANNVVFGTITAVGPGKAFSIYGPFNLFIWGSLSNALTTTIGSTAATAASGTGLSAGDAIRSVNVPPGTTAAAVAGTAVTLKFAPQFWPGKISTGAAAITGIGPLANGKSLNTLVGATIIDSPYFAIGVTVTAVGVDGISLVTSAAPTTAPADNVPVLICFAPTGNAVTVTGTDANATFTGGATAYNATIQVERSFDGGAIWIPCNIGAGSIAVFTTNGAISLAFGDPEAAMLYRINCLVFAAVTNVTIRYRISATGQSSTTLSVPAIS